MNMVRVDILPALVQHKVNNDTSNSSLVVNEDRKPVSDVSWLGSVIYIFHSRNYWLGER